MIARTVRIVGRVQGVGYRWSAAREAERLGVTGWVRNRPDGSVEARVQGPADAVDAMIGWMARGPTHAHVDETVVGEVAADPDAIGFRVRP